MHRLRRSKGKKKKASGTRLNGIQGKVSLHRIERKKAARHSTTDSRERGNEKKKKLGEKKGKEKGK